MTHHRLMTKVDPISYFTEVLPAIIPSRSSLPGTRRKFKLAYLVMVHDKGGFKQLCKLLELLDDGNAIIMVHVDARKQSQALYDMLYKWINKRSADGTSSIFLAKHRFSNIWGHISLVFTQLSGFWELLDLADWDYVINLSNYDYPIKRNNQIHTFLSNEKYKGMNFLEYWEETGTIY
jgi:hypothetical protein